MTRHLTIVGAGLAGGLLATLLAQRGWSVDVFERRGAPFPPNLALLARISQRDTF